MTICPKCGRSPVAQTRLCYELNPVFSCAFGLDGILHMHYWCSCGYSWVEIEQNVEEICIGF